MDQDGNLETVTAPADSPHGAADALDRVGTTAVVWAGAVGFIGAASILLSAEGAPLTASVVLPAILTVAGALLLGWVAGGLLRGVAAIVRILADQTEAATRIEQQVVAALDRLSGALAEPRSAAKAPPDGPDQATRQAAADDLLAKIEASRAVNDPDRVIELRDALRPLLAAEALRALDRDLAKWFVGVLFRRSRAGAVGLDVVALAAKVAERFDDTPEGAGIRASLPTLRRAAGLCARCGQPYLGIENACPICLAGMSFSPSSPAMPAPSTTSSSVVLAPEFGEDEPDD